MNNFPCNFRLIFRHHLKVDVRESLYDAAHEWERALGTRKFLGGSMPNLADLVRLNFFRFNFFNFENLKSLKLHLLIKIFSVLGLKNSSKFVFSDISK